MSFIAMVSVADGLLYLVLISFSEILHACIEENEGVSEPILDILLQPLLPARKVENPTAYRVCAVVVRAVSQSIRKTFTDVVQNVLVGSSASRRLQSLEIADEIYPLIYELHKVAPDMLTEVIPCLCQQLRVEEEDIRRAAVQLLCTLFTSSSTTDYATDYPRDFRDFLGRLNDLVPGIRIELLNCCALLLKTRKSDTALIEGEC
jgi:sister chromatid cohesion protein PDS5